MDGTQPARSRARHTRLGPAAQPGAIHHLVVATYRRQAIFSDLSLGRAVVQALRHQHVFGQVESMAFVVMPDHVHWLLRLTGRAGLPAIAQSFKAQSARSINRSCGTPGRRIWQPGYFDHVVRGQDARGLARYIIGNPLRSGLVGAIGEYALWDAIWL